MAKKSEGTEQKYQREDLIWEAVRRNELYKKDYYERLWEKCIEILEPEKHTFVYNHKDCNLSLFFNPDKYMIETQCALESFKWQEINYFNKYLRWKMLWLFNPEISFDDIKKAIATNQLQEKNHPYHHFYKQKRYPVIQFEVPGSMFNPQKRTPKHSFRPRDDDPSIVCIEKDVLKDRLIISVAPMADSPQIMAEITKAKKKAERCINVCLERKSRSPWIGETEDKDDAEGKSNFNIRYYNKGKIRTYIDWLKKYDTIIDNYLRGDFKDSLVFMNGLLVLPEERALFGQLVPSEDDDRKKKRESGKQDYKLKDASTKRNSILKTYEDAYQGAIELIQNAPNIIFNPARS